jgi:hypothetical protein
VKETRAVTLSRNLRALEPPVLQHRDGCTSKHKALWGTEGGQWRGQRAEKMEGRQQRGWRAGEKEERSEDEQHKGWSMDRGEDREWIAERVEGGENGRWSGQ